MGLSNNDGVYGSRIESENKDHVQVMNWVYGFISMKREAFENAYFIWWKIVSLLA